METWLERYNRREQMQIAACRSYSASFSDVALPGHTLMLLVATLSAQLDEAHRLLNGMPPGDASPDAAGCLSPAVPVPERPLSSEAPATEHQIKAIYAIALAARGWHPERVDEECGRFFHVPPEELSMREASRLIEHLKAG